MEPVRLPDEAAFRAFRAECQAEVGWLSRYNRDGIAVWGQPPPQGDFAVHRVRAPNGPGWILEELGFFPEELVSIVTIWNGWKSVALGSTQVENIQPFTAKQLSIRSLADCVLDLPQLHVLYPNRPKHEAFRRDYNTETRKNTSSYVPARLTITVDTPCSFATSIQKPVDTLGSSNVNLAVHSDSTYHDPPVMVPSSIGTSVASSTTYGSSQLPFELMTCSYPLGNASPLGSVDSYPMCQDVEMPDLSIPTENTVTYPGNLQLHLMADPLSVPETISPPSSEEFEKLLHPDQDLHPDLHFCHNPV